MSDSNLVNHAKRELELINEEPDIIAMYIKVVQAFADMGHSGGSAPIAIAVLERLFWFKPLSELTNDPDEWHFHEGTMWNGSFGVWQNKRDGEAFSSDGGKTYTLLSDNDRTKIYTSREVFQSAKEEPGEM